MWDYSGNSFIDLLKMNNLTESKIFHLKYVLMMTPVLKSWICYFFLVFALITVVIFSYICVYFFSHNKVRFLQRKALYVLLKLDVSLF